MVEWGEMRYWWGGVSGELNSWLVRCATVKHSISLLLYAAHFMICFNLIDNWALEFKRWCSSLQCLLYYGKLKGVFHLNDEYIHFFLCSFCVLSEKDQS